MLAKYHFKIEYIKGINNIRADILNRKAELQGNKGVKETILKMDENKKIKYNYLQLTGIYKALKLIQI